jgi:uncharacterized surface protein with fasciclin (FAS1) repeats
MLFLYSTYQRRAESASRKEKQHMRLATLPLAALLVLSTFALAGNNKKNQDIVDTAAAAGKFNTLAAALKAAGLAETLKGEGPFTVFAPTDEAFAKLPAGTVESLLRPENREKLRAVLLYHVVGGKVMASDVTKLGSAKTLNGQSVKIGTQNGVTVDNARVVMADVQASNGIIHVIDTVILPKN